MTPQRAATSVVPMTYSLRNVQGLRQELGDAHFRCAHKKGQNQILHATHAKIVPNESKCIQIIISSGPENFRGKPLIMDATRASPTLWETGL